MNAHPKVRTPLRDLLPFETGRDWYRVTSSYGDLLGPEHDIRIVSTGKLFRVGDLTYQRLRNGAAPTPEGWLELSEDGEPVEEEPGNSVADIAYQRAKERT